MRGVFSNTIILLVLLTICLTTNVSALCESWDNACTLTNGESFRPSDCTEGTDCFEKSKRVINAGESHFYKFDIPKDTSGGAATIAATVLSGDVKIYVGKPGQGAPSAQQWSWSSEQRGQEQTVINLGCVHWTSGNCVDLVSGSDNTVYGIMVQARKAGVYRIVGAWETTNIILDHGLPQLDYVEKDDKEYLEYPLTNVGDNDIYIDVTVLSGTYF